MRRNKGLGDVTTKSSPLLVSNRVCKYIDFASQKWF